MMAKKKSKWVPPDIDGKAKKGRYYLVISAKDTSTKPATTVSKEAAAAKFKSLYDRDPENVFYGKPGGCMIYCGPVHNLATSDEPPAQPNLM